MAYKEVLASVPSSCIITIISNLLLQISDLQTHRINPFLFGILELKSRKIISHLTLPFLSSNNINISSQCAVETDTPAVEDSLEDEALVRDVVADVATSALATVEKAVSLSSRAKVHSSAGQDL
jgi:hypothetical protein